MCKRVVSRDWRVGSQDMEAHNLATHTHTNTEIHKGICSYIHTYTYICICTYMEKRRKTAEPNALTSDSNQCYNNNTNSNNNSDNNNNMDNMRVLCLSSTCDIQEITCTGAETMAEKSGKHWQTAHHQQSHHPQRGRVRSRQKKRGGGKYPQSTQFLGKQWTCKKQSKTPEI